MFEIILDVRIVIYPISALIHAAFYRNENCGGAVAVVAMLGLSYQSLSRCVGIAR
jgi:hypothetical protein